MYVYLEEQLRTCTRMYTQTFLCICQIILGHACIRYTSLRLNNEQLHVHTYPISLICSSSENRLQIWVLLYMYMYTTSHDVPTDKRETNILHCMNTKSSLICRPSITNVCQTIRRRERRDRKSLDTTLLSLPYVQVMLRGEWHLPTSTTM